MKTTIGVFKTHATAEKGLQELKNSNINESDLSYLYKNDDGDVKDGQSGTKVATSTSIGAGTGAILGGIAGIIVANGIIPGLGTLIVAGPLAEALGIVTATAVAGAGVGAATGGLIGALTHYGVSTDDIHLYEEHVQKGGVLVIAKSEHGDVKEILERNEAHDINEYLLS